MGRPEDEHKKPKPPPWRVCEEVDDAVSYLQSDKRRSREFDRAKRLLVLDS